MRKWALFIGLLLLLATPWAGCQQNAVTVPVRSLERSGKAAFLCIRQPSATPPGLELRGCNPVTQILDVRDYSTPHVIALVNQEARGEVAVLDVTAGLVVDVNQTLPGANFLPVGALPTDIVATPGSSAAFVATGDPVRPGIFALSSSHLFLPGQVISPAPSLAGYPACSLPAVATQLAVVADRTGLGTAAPRAHCPGVSADAQDGGGPGASGAFDLSSEAALFGTLKLVALLPDLGQLAVIDAQSLLLRRAGSFDLCPIERLLPLRSDVAGPPSSDGGVEASAEDASPGLDAGATENVDGGADAGTRGDGSAEIEAGATCNSPAPVVIPPAPLAPHPAAMAYSDDGRLFISDDRASVIHVVDLSDPCAPLETAPLLPVSTTNPSRPVTTTAIAVSPLTTDNQRYVYAVDVKDNGSVMVFDVTPGAGQRTPLLRPDVQSNQREPPDRIAFSSPVASLTFARHELVPDSALAMVSDGGVVARGQKCDPTSANDPYRPPAEFVGTGAGPGQLRGIYGFLALSDGRVAVIDVDDFDRPCRRPQTTDDPTLGCSGAVTIPPLPGLPSASQEVSCNVVERHRPRSNQYFTNASLAGQHAPAMQGFPLLHDKDGTSLTVDPSREESLQRPKLLGPAGLPPEIQQLLAPVTGIAAADLSLSPDPSEAAQNWVTFDLAEPRAHSSQSWVITYEGVFAKGAAGRLQCAEDRSAIDCELGNPSHLDFYDSSLGFCNAGVQGGDPAHQGDVVEITSELPDPADPYWTTVEDICSRQSCETQLGTATNPLTGYDASGGPIGRNFIIDRAFQDHLALAPRPNPDPDRFVPMACCFPYPVSYSLRVGKQWMVFGAASGFAHHVVADPSLPDPSIGECVQSCDPTLALRNGRVVGLPRPTNRDDLPDYDDHRVFRNAQLRFVIWNPATSDCSVTGGSDAGGATQPCVRRDMYFSLQEVGGFEPLSVNLSATALVMPQTITFVPGLEQLAVPDPVSQGLMLFDLNTLRVVQTIF